MQAKETSRLEDGFDQSEGSEIRALFQGPSKPHHGHQVKSID